MDNFVRHHGAVWRAWRVRSWVGLVVRFVRVIRVSPVSGVSPGSRTVHVIS
jgi:hypothetical protein